MTPHLPDLRIVPIDALLLHEQHDAQRTAPLVSRLRKEGVLKNPPLVAPMDDEAGRFVVLDGANRTTALNEMGFAHVLVQVVQYDSEEVRLTTWNHVVAGIRPESFLDALKALEGLNLTRESILHARAALARRESIAYVVCPDAHVYSVRSQAPDLHSRTRLLNQMVDTYKSRARLYRTDTDQTRDLGETYPDLAALVVFPHHEPAEIIALARDSAHLPAGITRHIIAHRALRLNYPIEELAAERPLAEKNRRLEAWMREKLARREVRYYAESTFLFDE